MDGECAAPTLCEWPVDGGCTAKGICVTEVMGCEEPEGGQPLFCSCDGTPFHLACIYQPGYSPYPIASRAPACPTVDAGAGLDAGGD
jgi:hypothetical protein